MADVRIDNTNADNQGTLREGNEMITTKISATASSTDSQNPHHDPPFLRIPGELRNKIYAFATSCSSPLIVGIPIRTEHSWQLPALANVNKQVRQEVISIFFECNTLKIHSLQRATLWYPFRSTSHMQSIAALFLDWDSSRNWYVTLKAFNIQPTMVLRESAGFTTCSPKQHEVLSGEVAIVALVEEELFDLVVKWEPFERAVQSLAKYPRPNLFLTLKQLEEAMVK